MKQGFACEPFFRFPSPAKSFHIPQESFSFFVCDGSSFDAGHAGFSRIKILCNPFICSAIIKTSKLFFAQLNCASCFCIKMIYARRPPDQFARFGDFDAFGDCFAHIGGIMS
ncbi:MAG: hypothetical protein G01um101448_707 [Parcubacteria group bacterium Gr01-1014_48]|nr:MAG: hypothetical protein G01um101448_707 [Parcubacteria group bacterium Gr01-1014_48]